MIDNEKAICAINAAARAKDMSYGHFVAISTAAELTEIVSRFRVKEKKRRQQQQPKKPKQERCGRPSQYGGVSQTPEYAAAQQAKRRAQAVRDGRLQAEARAIRAWREDRGLTQKQLGALVGASGSAVFGWEKGLNGARWDELEKLGCARPTGDGRGTD